MLTFDEARHEYRWHGKIVPGVTSILDDEFYRFAMVDRDVLQHSRDLGTAVHKACEYHVQGCLEWESVHEEVEPYVHGFIKFLEKEKPIILFIETPLYHVKWGYAGKPDMGAVLFGERGIVDNKTAKAVDKVLAGPQTAGYLSAKNSELSEMLKPEEYVKQRYRKRWALQLTEQADYNVIELNDPNDETVFFSSLTLYRWRQKHGIARSNHG